MGPHDPSGNREFISWMQENCKEEFDQLYTRYLVEKPEPDTINPVSPTVKDLELWARYIKEGEYSWESELKKSAAASGSKKTTRTAK